jgi:hypothetical protein
MCQDINEQEVMILAQVKMPKGSLASELLGGSINHSLSNLLKLRFITIQPRLFDEDKVIGLTQKGIAWKKSHRGQLRKVQNKLKKKDS